MNLRPALILGCCLALPALRAADTPAAEAGSFTQNRARIDALFLGRDAAPVLPADVINPFSRPEERALAHPSASGAGPQPQLTDHALLERVVPAIQVRGIVQAAGRPSVIINRKLFQEGDVLTVLYGETTVEVVIKRIGDDTFTLGYKDAELTLRLPR